MPCGTGFPILALSLASLLVAVGCGGPDLANVKGVVTLDGRTLEGGSVTFIPESSGPLAYSDILPDGSYQLQSASTAGIPPGRYVATVSYRRGRPSSTMTIAQIEALEMVPVRYTTFETSDLHQEILAGENVVKLELTSPK